MSALTNVVNCAIALPLEVIETILGYSSSLALSFTINRLLVVCIFLPLYLTMLVFRVLPFAIGNFWHLVSIRGRRMLIRTTTFHRKREQQQAQLQFEGKFDFPEQAIFPVKRVRKEWMGGMPWHNETEEFKVCGATARFVHLRPVADGDSGKKKKKIVLLHGNPSWSYVWRNVLPPLVRQGHEVYALDWLGYGRSDKINRGGLINIELHMRTLIGFFDHTKLQDAVVVGHDWGGCIALCTIPYLPARACDGLFLIDTFLPPRFHEISLFNFLLHLIWYFSTGLLDGVLPTSLIIRYLVPHLSLQDTRGYAAPYLGLPASAKSSVQRLTHTVPIMPRYLLRFVRETLPWRLLEGFLGPENFTNVNAQARLAAIDDDIRDFWKSRRPDKLNQGTENGFKVAVAFGERDPLLTDYMYILPRIINRRYMTDCVWWLKRAGHYPMEERPYEIANLIRKVADR